MSHRGHKKTRQVREVLRREAEARQVEYDKLSLQQKIDRLPPAPHATKQRTKLLKQIDGFDPKTKTWKKGRGALTPEWALTEESAKAHQKRLVNAEGQFVKFGDENSTEAAAESKHLKAKDRRAQEKN